MALSSVVNAAQSLPGAGTSSLDLTKQQILAAAGIAGGLPSPTVDTTGTVASPVVDPTGMSAYDPTMGIGAPNLSGGMMHSTPVIDTGAPAPFSTGNLPNGAIGNGASPAVNPGQGHGNGNGPPAFVDSILGLLSNNAGGGGGAPLSAPGLGIRDIGRGVRNGFLGGGLNIGGGNSRFGRSGGMGRGGRSGSNKPDYKKTAQRMMKKK